MAIATSTAILLAAGIGAAGSISQGIAAKGQSDFQANVSRQRAASERQISASEEEDFRRKQSRLFAERRAASGRSGVEIGTGSPLLAAGDFAAETELQALRIRAGGKIRSGRLEQGAVLTRMGGRAAQRRGFTRAGSSLLSGFGEAFG